MVTRRSRASRGAQRSTLCVLVTFVAATPTRRAESLATASAAAAAAAAPTARSSPPPPEGGRDGPFAPRPLPLLGLGNELVWQSVNDTALADAARALGGTVGRYPGGTPSDYWNWTVGWATDTPGLPVRPATPNAWAAYANLSGVAHSVLVLNQLTSGLDDALAGLAAHEAAGTDVRFVECGNEMYDSTRPDVVKAYPTGRDYAQKMSTWAAAVTRAHPSASVAILAMTWRPGLSGREAAWNDQVFGDDPSLLANVSAATLHPYFAIDWRAPPPPPPPPGPCGEQGQGASGPWLGTVDGCADPCCCAAACGARPGSECKAWQWMAQAPHACYLKSSVAMAPNAGSVSGVAQPPAPPLPPPESSVAAALSSAFAFAEQNVAMVAKLPPRLALWVTELGGYGADELNFTWLEAFVNVLYENVLLMRIPHIAVMAPYCLVCGDPTAPGLESPDAQPSPPSRSVVPPALAGAARWGPSLRGVAHRVYFELVAEASLLRAPAAELQEIDFDEAAGKSAHGGAGAVGVGGGGGGASSPAPAPAPLRRLFGWRALQGNRTVSAFVTNLSPNTTEVDVAAALRLDPGATVSASVTFPRSAAGLVDPALRASSLGVATVVGVPASKPLALPARAVAAVRVQPRG